MQVSKKAIKVTLVAAILVLTLCLVPAVSGKKTNCDQTITFDDWGTAGPHPDHTSETMYWKGTITGEISATSYYWETDRNYVVGHVEHFFEDFYIVFDDGWVSGYDYGTWNFATFNFRSSGRVTAASANYEYMIGSRFFEEGRTGNPFDAEGNMVLPILGIGTCWFGP